MLEAASTECMKTEALLNIIVGINTFKKYCPVL